MLLTIAFLFASTTPGTVAAESTARKIYVANYASNTLGVFPINAKGNVPSLFTQTLLDSPQGIAYWSGNIYVANEGSDAITVYPSNVTGRPNPVFRISGSRTQLHNPFAIAIDPSGTVYVANRGQPNGFSNRITGYAPGSHGNVKPKAVIMGPRTHLKDPGNIAVDSGGNIYVVDDGADSSGAGGIIVYSTGSNGNVSPAHIISGPATRINSPGNIAIDSHGYLYVTSGPTPPKNSLSGNLILVFAPYVYGNVSPVISIDGDCSPLWGTGSLAIGAEGRIYVTSGVFAGAKVVVYPAINLSTGSSQCLTPEAEIVGEKTGLSFDGPMGIAVDPSGDIFVTHDESLSRFSSGAQGNIAPSVTLSGRTGLRNPTGIALNATGKIFVTNDGANGGYPDEVTIYPAGSEANHEPIATIGSTGDDSLASPQAIALGPDGSIYVANGTGGSSGSVAVFAAGADGKAAPQRVIIGTRGSDLTRLNDPVGLAIDSANNLYVANNGDTGSITVYAPTANGNVAPIRTIGDEPTNKKTQLSTPSGIALDASGNIYVTNDSSIGGNFDSITIYAAGSNGNVAPIAVITGPDTQLHLPWGIAVDLDGKIYVANDSFANDEPQASGPEDSITVYAAGANGNVAPIARINGPLTGLAHPMGIAVGP